MRSPTFNVSIAANPSGVAIKVPEAKHTFSEPGVGVLLLVNPDGMRWI